MVEQQVTDQLLKRRDQLVQEWHRLTEELFENPDQARQRLVKVMHDDENLSAGYEMMANTEEFSAVRQDLEDPFAKKRALSRVMKELEQVSEWLLNPDEYQQQEQQEHQQQQQASQNMEMDEEPKMKN